MDAAVEPLRSWRATAIFVASTLDAEGGLLDHPRVVAHVERRWTSQGNGASRAIQIHRHRVRHHAHEADAPAAEDEAEPRQ
jgi:hypothetical protein